MGGLPDPGYGALINRLANPPNPLTTLGQDAQALTAAKELQARNAMAGIYSQAIDPATGQLDLGKLNTLIGQNPAAAWMAGQNMQQAGQAVGAQGSGTQQDIAAKQAQIDAAGRLMFPLLRAGAATQSIEPEAVQTQLDQAHAAKLITDQQYNAWTGQLKSMSPQQAYAFVIGANEGNEGARSLFGGNVAIPNVGPAYQPVQLSPLGVKPASGPIPISPGVGETTLTVGTQTIQNVPYNVAAAITQNPDLLRVYYPQQYGAMHPGDQITMQPPAGGAPGGGNVAPGHFPAPAAPAATTGPPYLQPPPPQPAEAGGVGMTPQAGYVENVQQPSQKAATTLATAARDTPNVAGLINDMRAQVNQPGWNPGLGAQAGSIWRQVLDKVGINATGSTPDQQKMAQASYDEFAKDANLIASRQLATIGNPSDARQGLAEAITPGMAQSKEGVLGISATLLGNQDAINRTSAAWAQAKANGWSDGQHNQWINQNWNATDPKTGGRFDPRVFWLADTEGNRADQARRFASKIPAGQQAQFLKNVQYAKDQGWVKQNDDGSYAVVNP